MRMSLVEALRLKDQMPKGLFRGVEKRAADEIWLCAIEAAEQYHGIPRKEQRMNYEEFRKYLKEECMKETLYKDSEGRDILVIDVLSAFQMVWQAQQKEQDRCCRIIYGMAGSDNVAQRTVDAIRGKE